MIGVGLLLLNTSDNLKMIALDIACALCFAAAAVFLESLESAHGVSFYSGANLMQLSCGIFSFALLITLWLLEILTTNDPQGDKANFSYLFGLSLATSVILICEMH